MLKLIITAVINAIFGLLGKKREASVQSKNESLKGRADSVEESYSEQDKAREAAEKAKKETENQGNSDDVFGAGEWNGEKNEDTPSGS